MSSSENQEPPRWPLAGGEMGTLIRAHDWATTPLGPTELWPRTLRSTVELLLIHGFPMVALWGPDLIQIYNDGYRMIMADKHPQGLGQPTAECWPEVWHFNEPIYARVRAGETVTFEDALYPTTRHGPLEDAWFTLTYSPLRADDGATAGVLVTVFETTERHLTEKALRENEERQAFLLKLSDILRPLADGAEIQSATTRLVGEQLGVDRCYYFETDHQTGEYVIYRDFVRGNLRSLVGRHPIQQWPQMTAALSRGEMLVVHDFAHSSHIPPEERPPTEQLDIRAIILIPLVKRGRLVACMAAIQAVPREWKSVEVSLVAEVAERTWAAVERARAEAALRESEERLRQFGEASQDVLWIRNAETFQWEYLTPAFEMIYGLDREAALRGDNMLGWLDLIVPEDREHAACSLSRVRGGEWVTFEYRIRRPVDGGIRWLRNTDFPIRDAAGHFAHIGGIGHDITEIKQTAEALAAAELRQRALLEGMPQLVWRAETNGEWTWASPQWTEYTGQAEGASHGWGWLNTVHPDDHEIARQAWATAIETGVYGVEYRLRHAGTDNYRWFQTRAAPVRDEGGKIVEWLGTSTDIDELRSLQERQQVLVAELQHRTRNLIGVVRSIADKTGRTSADLPDFRQRFRDRLEALARVQGLLSRLHEHDRVTFDELIQTEIAALDGNAGRVTLSGPVGVRLRSTSVQTLALALHELGTNAVKYGALGQSSGHLAIHWSTEAVGETPWLHIDWRETGVAMPPPSAMPQGGGQGRELIEQALPYQLKARTQYELTLDGIHCTISLPISETMHSSKIGNA